jgi:hypothetical protein
VAIITNEESGESVDWMEKEEFDLNVISIPQDEKIHASPV